jgi:REP element-mobilizing transposase RayT
MISRELGYFDPDQPIEDAAGNLPHWRQEAVTYFVNFRLGDALPTETLALWERERDDWRRRNPPPHTAVQRKEFYERFVVRLQNWLDTGHGACVLGEPAVRQFVATALPHFADVRYGLREWVIMPNHVHAVLTPLAENKLSDILHSWKSYTSNAINRHLKRNGPLWQKESFDHIVRSPEQLVRIEQYIHDNPHGLPANRFTLGCVHNRSGR